jgi:hypothetical protein
MAKLQHRPLLATRPQKALHAGGDPRVCVLRPQITEGEGPQMMHQLPGCIHPDIRPRDREWQSDASCKSLEAL